MSAVAGMSAVAPVAAASVVSPSPLSKCFHRVKHAERLGGGDGGKALGGTEACPRPSHSLVMTFMTNLQP